MILHQLDNSNTQLTHSENDKAGASDLETEIWQEILVGEFHILHKIDVSLICSPVAATKQAV